MQSTIKTRILILSDTHGMTFAPEDHPLQHADVAIHCGDLTDGSKLSEYRAAITLLKSLDAPLKLAIAGNHDFTLDIPAFERKVADEYPPLDPGLVAEEYGAPSNARRLFEEARDGGIVFLDEGTHQFTLRNGASLTVYASPYTPSFGAWGFQYHPDSRHSFDIQPGTDVAVTHGPPRGIMDYTHGWERAGCPQLFSAIANSRPAIHCFGHIHEGWGARLVRWRDNVSAPTHLTGIDNEESVVIEKLAGLEASKYDSEEDFERKEGKREKMRHERCCATSHCKGDERPLRREKETLFVNASVVGSEGFLTQRPWLVDIELPIAT